jgi:phage FluMu gp28-like protein
LIPLSESAQKKIDTNVSKVLADVLLPYQRRYLLDKNRYLIWEKSRRVGVTWCSALKSVLKRITREKPLDHLFSSKDLNSSQEWLGYCRFWSEIFNDWLGEEVVPLKTWTSEMGHFANGSRLIILSSNPRSFRSMQGDVTLDEYAHHDQQDEIYKAAQPCMLWLPEAQFEVISSHNGPETQFNMLCRQAERKQNRFSWYRKTLEDAVADGLALKVWRHRIIPDFGGQVIDGRMILTKENRSRLDGEFIEDIRSGCATDEDYEQEYNCQPAKFSTLISPYYYDRCVMGQVEDELNPDRRYGDLYVGIDCGRSHDLTVVWVLEHGIDQKALPQFQDVYRTVCVLALRNMGFPEQEAMVRGIITHPHIGKGFIDQGVVGRGFAEACRDEVGSVVEPYAITAPRKATMYERVRQFVQMQRVSLPECPRVKQDLMCVRRTQTRAGHIQYEGHTKDSHGDYFCALALALEAATMQNRASMASYPSVDLTQPTPLLPMIA